MNSAFKECLETLDLIKAKKLWAQVCPHLPQPKNDNEMLIVLHHARTQSESIALKLRAYSHSWLGERGYPSGLPDNLRKSAERMYPRIAQAVGISLNSKSEWIRPVLVPVREAMELVVLEAADDKRLDDVAFVKARMSEAKKVAMRKLLGVR